MSAAEPALSAAPLRKSGRNAFFFIIVTVFIDMMAFAVIMPSMPYLVAELLNGEATVAEARRLAASGITGPLETLLSQAAPWGGFITTVYAVMNFIMAPILGGLSDRFGRRPVLLMSMGMLAIDFLIMGFAHSIWLLFLGRILAGISGATHSTAAAYIADVTEPEARAGAFGMLGMAFGLGFILGPAIGGFLGQVDPRLPFFASAALAGINFCYGLFVLPESLTRDNRRIFDWKRANPLGAFRHLMGLPYLAWFMLALGLFNFAHWVYPATFNYFAGVTFGWNEGAIGMALVAVGLGSALVQGVLTGRLIRRLGPSRVAILGLSVCAATFAAYALIREGWIVYLIIPIGALAGVMGPAINQIMSVRTPRNAQGELQGAIASVQSLANVFAPIALTQTFHFFTSPAAPFFFPGAAFALAAGICALSLIPLTRGLATAPAALDQRCYSPAERPADEEQHGRSPEQPI